MIEQSKYKSIEEEGYTWIEAKCESYSKPFARPGVDDLVEDSMKMIQDDIKDIT